jgi:TRAP-type C4-dicarboxylate transport system permease small subunit
VSWIGYVAIAAMIIYIVADICARKFFNHPLPSNLDLIYVALLSIGGFTMMWATVKKAHVKVDILFTRFPKRTQLIMDSFFSLIGLILWSVFTYFIFKQAFASFRIQETTVDLLIPVGIFLLVLGVSLIMFCISLLVSIYEPWLKQSQPTNKQTKEGY